MEAVKTSDQNQYGAHPGPQLLPVHERLRLVAAVTGRGRAGLREDPTVTLLQQRRIDDLIARRLEGEPLQYLEGTVAFGPIEVAVDERVLIPRPETEYLFELVGDRPAPSLVVDLGTGSGAVALALKRTLPSARVIGTDLSEAALEVAEANGISSELSVEWLAGDLFDVLPVELAGRIDLLVSNPPYVAEGAWGGLPEDVRREPRLALVAGPTGMEVAEKILTGVRRWLAPTGEAWLEVGEDQAQILAERFSAQVVIDQYGRDRYLRVDGS